MKPQPPMFPLPILIWAVFVALLTGLFFTRRVKRRLSNQFKSVSLRSAFSHNEYLRSDLYGAVVGWVGLVLVLVLLIVRVRAP